MKRLYKIFKFVFLAVVLIVGSLLIYDQISISFEGHLPEWVKPIGMLELTGIDKAFRALNNDTERLGYYLVFYGSSAMFIFIAISWVLKMIPILGKIMLWFLVLIPIIAVIIIVVGALMLTGIIPDVPGIEVSVANLSFNLN